MATASVYASLFLLSRFVRREIFTASTAAISRVETLPFEAIFVPLGASAILGLAAYVGVLQLAPLRPRLRRCLCACGAAAAASTAYAFVQANPVLMSYDPSLVHYALAPLIVVALAQRGWTGGLELLGTQTLRGHRDGFRRTWTALVVLVAVMEMVCTPKGVSFAHVARTLGHWFWTPRTLGLLTVGSVGGILNKFAAESCDRPGDSKAHPGSPWLLQPRRMFTGLLVLSGAEALMGLATFVLYTSFFSTRAVGDPGTALEKLETGILLDIKEFVFALMGRGLDFDPLMTLLLVLLHTLERTAFWIMLTVAPLAPTLMLICCAEMNVRGFSGHDMSFLSRAAYFAAANAAFAYVVYRMQQDEVRSQANAHTFSPVAAHDLQPWSSDMGEVDLERGQRRRRAARPSFALEDPQGEEAAHAPFLPTTTAPELSAPPTMRSTAAKPISPLSSPSEKPPRQPGRGREASSFSSRRPRPRVSPTITASDTPGAAGEKASYSLALEDDD